MSVVHAQASPWRARQHEVHIQAWPAVRIRPPTGWPMRAMAIVGMVAVMGAGCAGDLVDTENAPAAGAVQVADAVQPVGAPTTEATITTSRSCGWSYYGFSPPSPMPTLACAQSNVGQILPIVHHGQYTCKCTP
jgi:hypothetical protein